MKASDTNVARSDVQKLLEEVGLTDTEARIYLAGHAVDSITVQAIGTATGVKRPTIYHALHTLSEKGLVSEGIGDGKTSFRMEAPGKLLSWIEEQKDALVQKEDAVHALITQLAARTPVSNNEMTVTHYADVKSVQAVFDLAFYARSKQCVIVVPSKDFLEELKLDERSRDAEHRGFEVKMITRKGIDSALLIYDENIVIFANPSNATVLTSLAFATILSNLL